MKKENKITIELNQKQIDIIFQMSDECGSAGEYWNQNWYRDRDAYRDLIMKTIKYTTDKKYNKMNYDGYIKKWKNYSNKQKPISRQQQDLKNIENFDFGKEQ